MKFLVASSALAFLGLSGLSSAAYTLQDNFVSSNFFSQFNFYTGNDPTNGFVNYVDQGTAQNSGLINTNNNKIHIGVDSTTVNPGGRGRNSVRIESKKQYTHGLFLLDLNHMPSSTCGVWPAFWTYGPNWPNSGEIDILEGVNNQGADFVSLHTGGTCKATSGGFNGQLTSSDCAVSTGGGTGCSIHSTNGATYGNGLNNVGGGVYAMEWLSSGIKVWFFARNAGIPGDISNGNPNPGSWGTPMANFPSNNCNIDANFANHWIVFDTTFCGDWAGADFANNGACKNLASSCQAYVAGNPGAFSQAYWDVNSLKVYKQAGTMQAASEPSSTEPVATPIASAVSSAGTSTAGGHNGTSKASSYSTHHATATSGASHASPSSVASAAPSGWWNGSDGGHAVGPNGQNWNDSWKEGHMVAGHDHTAGHSKRHAHVHAHTHGRRGRKVERSF